MSRECKVLSCSLYKWKKVLTFKYKSSEKRNKDNCLFIWKQPLYTFNIPIKTQNQSLVLIHVWYYNPLLLIVLFNVKSLVANLCFLWVRSHIPLHFEKQALAAAQICIPHLVIINVLRGKGGGKRTLFQSMFLPNSFWLNLKTKAELYWSTSFLSHLSCFPFPTTELRH